MKELLKVLGVVADLVVRLLLLSDKRKQEKRNEEIADDPVGSFEQRFGQLHDDPGSKPSVSTGTAQSSSTATRSTGTGDIHRGS